MKELAKHAGVFVMLIGVAVMVITFFSSDAAEGINTQLLLGTILILNGYLGHIFINNMKQGTIVSTIIWAVALLGIPFLLYWGAKKVAYSAEDFAVYN